MLVLITGTPRESINLLLLQTQRNNVFQCRSSHTCLLLSSNLSSNTSQRRCNRPCQSNCLLNQQRPLHRLCPSLSYLQPHPRVQDSLLECQQCLVRLTLLCAVE